MEKKYKIGEIAKKIKVTTRTLRFYEEKGILIPEFVDEYSGYRYYSENQIVELKKIIFLKDLGFSLDDISNYLKGDEFNKVKLIKVFLEQAKGKTKMLTEILNKKLFDLKFLENKNYYGNDIKEKDVEQIVGVWQIEGIYKNIKDVKSGNKIEGKITPYSFLAFDKNGESPWFYYASAKKIIFNTFYLPLSELYVIKNGKLFLFISNPYDHIFFDKTNSITFNHILVYTKRSENFEDYKNFMFRDQVPSSFIVDDELIGVFEKIGTCVAYEDNNKIFNPSEKELIYCKKNGEIDVYNKDGCSKLYYTKGMFYDKTKSITYKYIFKDDCLYLEKKTRIYTFTGLKNGYDIYRKI